MFPYQLNWKLTFSWGYWATWFCLLYLLIMCIGVIFYVTSVAMVVRKGLHREVMINEKYFVTKEIIYSFGFIFPFFIISGISYIMYI